MGYALFLRDGITKRGERVKAGKTGGDWNPWHGCTKISPGCKHCYVYRQDEMYGEEKENSVGSAIDQWIAAVPQDPKLFFADKKDARRRLQNTVGQYGFHLLHLGFFAC